MGKIINDSRTLTRQILTFGNHNNTLELRDKIIRRHITLCWSLAHSLRELDLNYKLIDSSSEEELTKIGNSSNIENLLLLKQQQELKELELNGSISDFDFR